MKTAPDSADAVYQLGLIELDKNNISAAREQFSRLRAISPQDPRLADLDAALRLREADKGTLDTARSLAKSGNYSGAMQQYQAALQGLPPSGDLAVEYYQTLSATEGGYEPARQGLATQNARNPGNKKIALAYGQILTYREPSRREGVAILEKLASDTGYGAEARASLRQALLWMDPRQRGDKALYDRWMAANPDDLEVKNYYEKATRPLGVVGQSTVTPDGRVVAVKPPVRTAPIVLARTKGYQALEANRLSEAAKQFNAAIKSNSRDAEAIAGLGIVRLRQERFVDARDLLQKASTLAPKSARKWASALDSARYWATVRQAESLEKKGEYAQAIALLTPLQSPSPRDAAAVRTQLAGLYAKAGNIPAAEQLYRQALRDNSGDAAAVSGLIGLLTDTGRDAEALALANQFTPRDSDQRRNLNRLRAQTIATQARMADKAGDRNGAMQNYQAAIGLSPSDPWLRLDFARFLQAQGDRNAAMTLMGDIENAPSASAEALHAVAVFWSEQQDWPRTANVLRRIPDTAMTNDMRRLYDRAGATADVDVILRDYNMPRGLASVRAEEARARLIRLANANPGNISQMAAIASGLVTVGARDDAARLAKNLVANEAGLPVAQRIALVDVLLKTGQLASASALIADLSQNAGLQSGDLAAFKQARDRLAIDLAKEAQRQGDLAAAYDYLAPLLDANPRNGEALRTLAGLYNAAQAPDEAMVLYVTAMDVNPQDLDALRGAVGAAIDAQRFRDAGQLLDTALQRYPNDAELWYLASQAASAANDRVTAIKALERAQALYNAKLDKRPLANPRRFVPRDAQPVLPSSDNPFRREGKPALPALPSPFATASAGQNRPLLPMPENAGYAPRQMMPEPMRAPPAAPNAPSGRVLLPPPKSLIPPVSANSVGADKISLNANMPEQFADAEGMGSPVQEVISPKLSQRVRNSSVRPTGTTTTARRAHVLIAPAGTPEASDIVALQSYSQPYQLADARVDALTQSATPDSDDSDNATAGMLADAGFTPLTLGHDVPADASAPVPTPMPQQAPVPAPHRQSPPQMPVDNRQMPIVPQRQQASLTIREEEVRGTAPELPNNLVMAYSDSGKLTLPGQRDATLAQPPQILQNARATVPNAIRYDASNQPAKAWESATAEPEIVMMPGSGAQNAATPLRVTPSPAVVATNIAPREAINWLTPPAPQIVAAPTPMPQNFQAAGFQPVQAPLPTNTIQPRYLPVVPPPAPLDRQVMSVLERATVPNTTLANSDGGMMPQQTYPFPQQQQVAQSYDDAPPPDADEIRARLRALGIGAYQPPTDLRAPVPVDALGENINRDLSALRKQSSAVWEADAGLRWRTGETGFSRLFEGHSTAKVTLPAGALGQVAISASPVFLSSGSMDGAFSSVRRFGTLALQPQPAPAVPPALPPVFIPIGANDTTAAGLGLQADYSYGDFKIDFGTTPLGFEIVNAVGGVSWNPALSKTTKLQTELSRRAVTDSVLSYAGAVDPLTGQKFGGVLKTGGKIGLTYELDKFGLYGDVGAYNLTGDKIDSNNMFTTGAGAYYKVWDTPNDSIKVGLNGTYEGYSENLRNYTLGHGGYFSPERFVSLSVPVEYDGKRGPWEFGLNGAVGIQSFQEEGALYFPNNAALQAQLTALGGADPTTYAPQSRTSVSIKGGGDFDYALTDRVTLGGEMSYERAADWNEGRALVRLKYRPGSGFGTK